MKIATCLVVSALALSGCAAVAVPVKVAGTAAGTATKAVGETILIVTRDAHALP